MKYQLDDKTKPQTPPAISLRRLLTLLQGERVLIVLAALATIITSVTTLITPLIIGHTIDAYIEKHVFSGVLTAAGSLLAIYLAGAGFMYMQTKLMGTVGQQLLFNLRQEIFAKLQSLPLSFFNQNKAGDLISRINNDTDTLNQFFSQSLVQLASSAFQMAGAALCLVILNPRLGLAALVPAAGLIVFTKIVSPWIKRENARSLAAVGNMSADISESLGNFKLVAIYNRQDYFRSHFDRVNQKNYQAAVTAGIANHTLGPVYSLASNLAQMVVLGYGTILILNRQLTVGLLIGYLSYISRFYDPIRQVAGIWSTFQTALAGWDRICHILDLKNNLATVKAGKTSDGKSRLAFKNVTFTYDSGKTVLNRISFDLEKGKTYAFVGPTGGGKTTTASLMARLYDPTKGHVFLNGRDLRSVPATERTDKIGFILQEPFLFSGTVKDNILYGNTEYQQADTSQMEKVLGDSGLAELLERFPQGLDTRVNGKGESLSLGQQQLIAFMRAILRKPELLILDEATANVDTVTEKLLDKIIARLGKDTTRVIIAHRFNTIQNANAIYFVNGGRVARAGSLKHAMQMLSHDAHKS